jgi:hypothetical protein
MRRPKLLLILTFALSAILVLTVLLNSPQVQDRVGWRVSELLARIKYAVFPPEQVVFVPDGISSHELTPTNTSISTQTPLVENTLESSEPSLEFQPTVTITPTPIPSSRVLAGFRHEYQSWNNCGPATLAMALSYWGWDGDQRPIAAFTKPNSRDKNVMPHEMAAFVAEETSYEIIVGVGGEVEILKQFIAADLPVVIEKGFEGPDLEGWMGHYVLVTGYNDLDQTFIIQDSYYGPDQLIKYEELNRYWRAFNFAYLVIYPDWYKNQVMNLIGPRSDNNDRYRYAVEKASEEVNKLSGRDQFFAWFNRGSSLVALEDYDEAAIAYDQAFKLYPTIPEKERPWRMLWYQTGPYQAYYYTGRYQDVVNLAGTTLSAISEPVLEESYYWRARALLALEDRDGAIKDLQTSLKVHPGFSPSLSLLHELGVDQ